MHIIEPCSNVIYIGIDQLQMRATKLTSGSIRELTYEVEYGEVGRSH